MHIHILGICGTFMGGIARLAQAQGHKVTGSDRHVYPPMSEQLAMLGITIDDSFQPHRIEGKPDLYVIGNAISRGNLLLEHILNAQLPYTSGPGFLAQHILPGRHVLAVAGTHGKTTTASLLTWILKQQGMDPGYLIGGVVQDLPHSAELGSGRPFVVEADEYDTAFFDKRSKFVHYQPRTLILNNLEFDHADIFDDLAAIQRQFHHVVRIVPSDGLILSPPDCNALNTVLAQGCWSRQQAFQVVDEADPEQAGWQAQAMEADGSQFAVWYDGVWVAQVRWSLYGRHNLHNALAALAAAYDVGVSPEDAGDALSRFRGVRRRLEVRGHPAGITVYDDFAHHPTAIQATLTALRQRTGDQARILALLEPRSNTMRMGVHSATLLPSLAQADQAMLLIPEGQKWLQQAIDQRNDPRIQGFTDSKSLLLAAQNWLQKGDHALLMSNGGFDRLHERLIKSLQQRSA